MLSTAEVVNNFLNNGGQITASSSYCATTASSSCAEISRTLLYADPFNDLFLPHLGKHIQAYVDCKRCFMIPGMLVDIRSFLVFGKAVIL